MSSDSSDPRSPDSHPANDHPAYERRERPTQRDGATTSSPASFLQMFHNAEEHHYEQR